jgi:hypothetical protein
MSPLQEQEAVAEVARRAREPHFRLDFFRLDFLRPLDRFLRPLDRFLRPPLFFFGTFAPSRRASESPIAIACLRLFTVFPEPPLLSVPRLRSCIARFTFCDAFLLYRVAMMRSSRVSPRAKRRQGFGCSLRPRRYSSNDLPISSSILGRRA